MQVKIQRFPVHGVLLLNKPLGMSSNQALQKVKWLLKAKKAGHTGNLDPLATGVLPLCFGEATKFSSYGLEADKTYIASIQLGQERTTGDAEGEVKQSFAIPELNRELIENTLQQFLGAQEQIPPMYSALKQDGKKLYELARAGQEVQRQPRRIEIYSLRLLDFSASSLRIEVSCSKGTYIRVLGEDLARALGSGGYLSSLERTEAGGLKLAACVDLAHLIQLEEAGGAEAIKPLLHPVDYLVEHLEIISLNSEQAQAVQHGQSVRIANTAQFPIATPLRMYTTNNPPQFLGLGQIQTTQQGLGLQPTKMLAE